MELRALELRLKGFGAPATRARVELAELSRTERLRRAGMIFLWFLLVALVAIPIPLVHFVLVPGALLLGIVLAVRRLGQGEIFREVQGRCPFCGAEQSFQVMGRFRLPKTLHCSSCGRELVLEEKL